MTEHFPREIIKNKRSKNPAKLLIEGWRLLKRRDQLLQISYVNLRLRKDYSNCEGKPVKGGDYAIYAERLATGGGLRKVEYVRQDENGLPSTRRVTIINSEESYKNNDIQYIIIDDMPLGQDAAVTQTFSVAEGLGSQPDFPLAELESELDAVYKDAKPHLWPDNPFWL